MDGLKSSGWPEWLEECLLYIKNLQKVFCRTIFYMWNISNTKKDICLCKNSDGRFNLQNILKGFFIQGWPDNHLSAAEECLLFVDYLKMSWKTRKLPAFFRKFGSLPTEVVFWKIWKKNILWNCFYTFFRIKWKGRLLSGEYLHTVVYL